MKLVIDVGNSRVKWATVKDGKFSFGGALAYKEHEIDLLMERAWAEIKPDQVAMATVGDEAVVNAIKYFVKKHWHKDITMVVAELANQGVKNNYDTPLLLGADRWAAIVAAWQLCRMPFCLFAFGTALTTDIVDAQGVLQGGTISPGLNLMCESLVARAAKLKSYQDKYFVGEQHYSAQLEAKDTKSAITNGALLMAIAFLEQSKINLTKKYGASMRFLVIGGDAEFVLPHLSGQFEHHPDLALKGIDLLSE